MTIFRFALLRSVRSVSGILLIVLLPVGVIFVPGDGWDRVPVAIRYYSVILMFAAANLTHLLLTDRLTGMTVRIAAAPVSHLKYLAQHLLAFVLLLTVQNAIVAAAGRLLHGERMPDPVALFPVLTVFSVTAVCFALAWNSLFRSKETSATLLFCAILFLSMLGGLLWPIVIMPELLQKAAMFIPTYWLVAALAAAAGDGGLRDAAVPMLMLLLFSTAFLLAGSKRRLA